MIEQYQGERRELYDLYAEAIYLSLFEQNFNSANWSAAMYRIKGAHIIRG